MCNSKCLKTAFKTLITQHASHLCYNRLTQGCVQMYNLTVTFEKIGHELMRRGGGGIQKCNTFRWRGGGGGDSPRMGLGKLVLLTAYRAHLVKKMGIIFITISTVTISKLKNNSDSLWVMYAKDGLFGGTYEAK